MTSKIEYPITGYGIKKATVDYIELPTEPLAVDDVITGVTYKLADNTDHATYVTINNQGSRIIQIFVYSKDPDKYLVTQLIGRMASSVMRLSNNVMYLADELIDMNEPNSGYWKKGVYYKSWVSNIGEVLKQRIKELSV